MPEKSKKMLKIVVTAAGTGGHIYPLISIILKLRESGQEELGSNIEFLFIGSREKFEGQIFDNINVKQEYVKLSGLSRKNVFKMAKFVVNNKLAENKIKKIIKEFKPDISIGAGGYLTYPVIKISKKLGVKTVIHEQNLFPGLANKLSSKYTDMILLGFKDSEKYFKDKNKLTFTGNPIRDIDPKSILLSKEERSKGELRILAFGGSLGAKRINEIMLSVFDKLEKDINIKLKLITGKNDYLNTLELVNTLTLKNKNNLEIINFSNDIYALYDWSDLVVLRSGAISVEEIKLFNKPAIFVPFKRATENHQYYNAKSLVDKNAAYLFEESDFKVQPILKLIKDIYFDRKILDNIKQNLKKIKRIDSSKKIAELILSLANEKDTK